MSGIVGVVHQGGEPVDRHLVERLTESLDFRGPDARNVWIGGNAGFGHTLLRTTRESEREHQPLTLDGAVFIVADARIDARAELIADLRARGQDAASDAPDVELILRAYQAWGEDCAEHLLGDFAFAIWDAPRRRLFCARDHLGIKPFFYFLSSRIFLFGNTLDCLRMHPAVSNRLNDLAIADFLLFEMNQDPATSTFADIQRLPPAHAASVSIDGLRMRRYWTMPIDEPLYYPRNSDYVERFSELLTDAVRDRIRTPWVGVFMSGGIDSPTLAATACRLFGGEASRSVASFTSVYDRLIPDDERYYAGLVAARLGIPIHFRALDDLMIDPGWQSAALSTPEPVAYPLARAEELKYFRDLSGHGRVFFYGEGPDNALNYEWRAYLTYLARRGRWPRLVRDVLAHMIAHRRVPLVSTLLRTAGRRAHVPFSNPQFPMWMDEDFVSRLDLRARWAAVQRPTTSDHPVRPVGYGSFCTPIWQGLLDCFDPGFTGAPLEIRHPYLDLRLLRFMLAVPAIPWCRKKYLLRSAMRGVLPPEVLARAKSPLAGDPLSASARRVRIPPLVPTPELLQYVRPQKVSATMPDDAEGFWLNLRPIVLDHWLRHRGACFKMTLAELSDGFSREAT
ncbi:MAG: asparagine synthase-related protein [Candidatus Binatus sp.]|uniref:asparagine synthase-related protein n=1 Tax=Candidatus Binatus sp. TaxID=2811406 RepID=UPI002717B7B1|nr:asparagine synthase-related protein [Candidatus Binatus sp.]MDO8432474.1 asparagine synthase-related protein [Candidatus Binatus sp.]